MARPVFAFLAFTSGSYEGAIIRDMRLANVLHRRGYQVVIYWMMNNNPELVDHGIPQRMLCYASRYQFSRPSGVADRVGRVLRLIPAHQMREYMQHHPLLIDRLMTNCCRSICAGGESDRGLVSRLIRFMKRDGVTHLLPTFAMICPFALAAKQRGTHEFDYLATFQGEEIFANYAEQIERLDDYHQRLREVVAGSPWPAIAVSKDYIHRLHDEMGIDDMRMSPSTPVSNCPRQRSLRDSRRCSPSSSG